MAELKTCGDCIHADVCKKIHGSWFSRGNLAECTAFQDEADFAKVVRCKDCKFWADGLPGCTDHVKCCKIGFYMVLENGYCVFGERKTDG